MAIPFPLKIRFLRALYPIETIQIAGIACGLCYLRDVNCAKFFQHALTALFVTASSASAALYTYQLSNVSAVQGGHALDGNITINTAGETENGAGSGNFFISHSAIIAWNWTVTYAGGGGYSGSSNGINASAFGNGGILAMYATPTYLAVLKDGSLNLQSDVDVAGADVKVEWLYHTPIYYSGGTGTGGAVWLNTDRSALDAAFPAAPVGTAENWIIATAVPEPSASLLCIVGCLLLLRRSRV